MSTLPADRIITFIKKNKEELSQNTGIDEFAELMEEIFNTQKAGMSYREKVANILDSLNNEDGENQPSIVEGDLQNYVERLVKYIEGNDDPLEQNNLKKVSRSTSRSSDEDDHKGSLKIQKHKRDRSRDKGDKHKKSNKSKSNPKQGQNLTLANLLQMNLTDLQKVGKNQNIGDLLKQLVGPNKQGPPQYQNNRKDIVFLLNMPKEMRTYSEIEAILAGKGPIAKIQLGFRVPSVHFKRQQDAQAILESSQFIVHKGVKIEFSATPNIIQTRRRDNREEQQKQDEEPKKKVIVLDSQGVKKAVVLTPNEVKPVEKTEQELQRQEQEQKKQQSKEEHEHLAQLETMKSQAKSLIAERLRLIFLLIKRASHYSATINQEIEGFKQTLKNKKEDVNKLTSIDQIKEEIAWLNENYDYTMVATELPEQHFKDKTITKVLNEYFSTFGKIDSLTLKIKDKKALIKFFSFESAERAYMSPTQTYKLEFLNKGITKVLLATS